MEDELELGQSFRNAYEATKYRAEVLVRRACEPGCRSPSSVPLEWSATPGPVKSIVSTASTTSACCLVASPVAVPVPLAGEGRAPLNLVPVDYVVDASHAIVSDPTSIGQTFHVVDPNPLPARRVYEADRGPGRPQVAALPGAAQSDQSLASLPGHGAVRPREPPGHRLSQQHDVL